MGKRARFRPICHESAGRPTNTAYVSLAAFAALIGVGALPVASPSLALTLIPAERAASASPMPGRPLHDGRKPAWSFDLIVIYSIFNV
ncbi:hypothetical protein PATSB16_20490 [Pandoraea thiooxydans]|nr:hypothetical protein PATSB16_20490 [Pandoraea thiooxydans]